jgi:hypothetical protein
MSQLRINDQTQNQVQASVIANNPNNSNGNNSKNDLDKDKVMMYEKAIKIP